MGSAIDKLLFERFKQSVETQAIIRILFGLMLLCFGPLGVSMNIARTPVEFFDSPLGPAQLIPVPAESTVPIVNAICFGFAWALLLGVGTRFTSLAVGCLMVVARCWSYSFGKIDHDILFVLVPFVLAFSRWGERYSIDSLLSARPRKLTTSDRDAWPFALLAICLALGMATSGFQKIIGGWLNPSSQATLAWIAFVGDVWGRTETLGYRLLPELAKLPSVITEALDWSAVGLEILFPLALIRRRLFQLICCVAVTFHLGTQLLFGIYFYQQVLVYGAFFAWDAFFGSGLGILARLQNFLSRKGRVMLWQSLASCAAACLGAVIYFCSFGYYYRVRIFILIATGLATLVALNILWTAIARARKQSQAT